VSRYSLFLECFILVLLTQMGSSCNFFSEIVLFVAQCILKSYLINAIVSTSVYNPEDVVN
jgi:hypothetical protein